MFCLKQLQGTWTCFVWNNYKGREHVLFETITTDVNMFFVWNIYNGREHVLFETESGIMKRSQENSEIFWFSDFPEYGDEQMCFRQLRGVLPGQFLF